MWGCKMLSAVVPRACFGDKTITKDSLSITLTVCAAHAQPSEVFVSSFKLQGLSNKPFPST